MKPIFTEAKSYVAEINDKDGVIEAIVGDNGNGTYTVGYESYTPERLELLLKLIANVLYRH